MKVITGNRLDNGVVIFLREDEQWTSDLTQATRFEDDAAKTALAKAQGRVKEIADLYLITVNEAGALIGRETLRETIRKTGPSVRADLGIQAGA